MKRNDWVDVIYLAVALVLWLAVIYYGGSAIGEFMMELLK